MKIFNEICRLPEFETDLRKLLRRFKTLEDDLKIFIEKQINLYHKLKIDYRGIFQITGLPKESPKIYKAKKFAYFEEKDKFEFIEI